MMLNVPQYNDANAQKIRPFVQHKRGLRKLTILLSNYFKAKFTIQELVCSVLNHKVKFQMSSKICFFCKQKNFGIFLRKFI